MKGIYINLDSRSDRREHFETNIKKYPFFSDIQRMSAVEHNDGSIGCGLSHIKALETLMLSPEPYVAVLEDDFMIFNEENLEAFVLDFEKIKDSNKWKVIPLTPRGITVIAKNEMTESGFKRIRDNQTTTGYIVKKEMIPILLKNIREAIDLQGRGVNKNDSSIDQYWKRLQIHHHYYYYLRVYGGQLPGWSNIENRVVDYNERFRNQPQY